MKNVSLFIIAFVVAGTGTMLECMERRASKGPSQFKREGLKEGLKRHAFDVKEGVKRWGRTGKFKDAKGYYEWLQTPAKPEEFKYSARVQVQRERARAKQYERMFKKQKKMQKRK